MYAKAKYAQEQEAKVIHELQVAENVSKRLRECATIAHVADHENALVNDVDGADEPKRRLQAK